MADTEAADGLSMFGVEVTETRTYRKIIRAADAEAARILALEEFKTPASFEMLTSKCEIDVDPDSAHEWEGFKRMAARTEVKATSPGAESLEVKAAQSQ